LQRALAILLVLGFSFPLIRPVLSADSASKLPSCCRRDGKHQCSMMMDQEEDPQAPSLVASGRRSKCPLYPPGKAMPAVAKATLSRPAVSVPAPAPSRVTPAAQPESRYQFSLNLANPERGPPPAIS
jgi:hypothetical protein